MTIRASLYADRFRGRKLTPETVAAIRIDLASMTIAAVARKYAKHPSTVQKIKAGTTWQERP